MVELGRMGMNMAARLLRGGHQVVVCDPVFENSREPISQGATAAYSLEEMAGRLSPPRAVWLMLAAADAVDTCLQEVSGHLYPGDTLMQGVTLL